MCQGQGASPPSRHPGHRHRPRWGPRSLQGLDRSVPGIQTTQGGRQKLGGGAETHPRSHRGLHTPPGRALAHVYIHTYTYLGRERSTTHIHIAHTCTHMCNSTQKNQWGQVACSLAWRSPLWRGPPLLGKPASPGRPQAPTPIPTAQPPGTQQREGSGDTAGSATLPPAVSPHSSNVLGRRGNRPGGHSAMHTTPAMRGTAGGWGDSPGTRSLPTAPSPGGGG